MSAARLQRSRHAHVVDRRRQRRRACRPALRRCSATISGIAPRARIAAYKALWSTQDAATASGSTADLTAAVDAAVGDGVDIINYSISGDRTSIESEQCRHRVLQRRPGRCLCRSVGRKQRGDLGLSQVNRNAPWLTTVAAGTHDRGNQKTVTLGNGTG